MAFIVPTDLPATMGRRPMAAHPSMAPIVEAIEASHAAVVHAAAARLVLNLPARPVEGPVEA